MKTETTDLIAGLVLGVAMIGLIFTVVFLNHRSDDREFELRTNVIRACLDRGGSPAECGKVGELVK